MKIDPRLLNAARSVRLQLALAIGAGALGGVLAVAQAWWLSQLVAELFLRGGTLESTRGMLLSLLAAIVGRAALVWIREESAGRAAAGVKVSLRERLLAHIVDLGPGYLGEERTGELANTATSGIEALDAYFTQYLPSLALAALIPLTLLAFIFPLDLLSGILLLVTAPLIPLFMVLIGKAADHLTRRQWSSLSRMSAHFLDVLQGLTTLKLFGRSRAQIEIVGKISEQFGRATLKVLRVAFLSALVLELLATISTAVIAVEVGLRLLYGTIEFQQAFFVLILAPEFYLPLRTLGASFHAGISGIAAAQRLFDVLEQQATIDGESPHEELPPSREAPTIRFEELSHSYDGGERETLRAVSFGIEAGHTVAIVGRSGAGKSTLANLLLRFTRPDSGQITVNGVPLDRFSPEEWRRNVAWVPQSPHLFHGTVAENLRVARPEATMDELIAATRMANANDFIRELPNGYDTEVGERGARLSGGQAQRVALARAFLKDAPLVILDEAASGLDVENEALVQQAVDRLRQDRTVLAIAHRLSTAARADSVVVLHDGQIVEQGTHQQLLAQDGPYRRLVEAALGEKDATMPPSGGHDTTMPPSGGHDTTMSPSGGHPQADVGAGVSAGPRDVVRRHDVLYPGAVVRGVARACTIVGRAGRDAGPYTRSHGPSSASHLENRIHTTIPSTESDRWIDGGDPEGTGTTDAPSRLNSLAVFYRLVQFAWPYRWRMALAVVLGFFTVASGIGLMATSAFIIADAALHPSVADLAVAIVGVRFFGLSRGVFRYLERYVSHQATFRLLAGLRVWFYSALEPLAPAGLARYRSGDLLARIVADVETLEHLFVRVLAPPAVAVLVAFMMFRMLGQFSRVLPPLLLVFYLLAGIALPLLARRQGAPAAARTTKLRARMQERLVDGLQGMAELVAFGRHHDWLQEIERLNRETKKTQYETVRLAGMSGAGSSLLSNLAMAAVLVAAIPLVTNGQMPGLYLPVIAMAVLASFEAILPLPLALQQLEGALEAGRRLLEIVDTGTTSTVAHVAPEADVQLSPLDTEDNRKSRPTQDRCSVAGELRRVDSWQTATTSETSSDATGGNGLLGADVAGLRSSREGCAVSPAISIRGLSFRYAPEEPEVLRGIDLTVMPGERVAIVGPSGGGKSTLFNLLVRFWEYQEGSILLYGRDLRSYPRDEIHRLMAVVSQRTYLFNATLLDNLRLARPDAGQEEVEHAAEAAQLASFARGLPDSYGTWVGEGGARLSGGERQRVAIARAILAGTPIQLMDEATANLDASTEREVVQGLQRLMENRTVLAITHRLAGLEAMDRILVMESGRIVQSGSYHELLAQDGPFLRMRQLERDLLS